MQKKSRSAKLSTTTAEQHSTEKETPVMETTLSNAINSTTTAESNTTQKETTIMSAIEINAQINNRIALIKKMMLDADKLAHNLDYAIECAKGQVIKHVAKVAAISNKQKALFQLTEEEVAILVDTETIAQLRKERDDMKLAKVAIESTIATYKSACIVAIKQINPTGFSDLEKADSLVNELKAQLLAL